MNTQEMLEIANKAACNYYNSSIEAIKEFMDMPIKFGEFLKCMDNGTTFHNPITGETLSMSIGFSPNECFEDGSKSIDELFQEFLKFKIACKSTNK